MAWTALTFGKHKGKTLPQIIFADPDWFFWAVEEGVFEDRGPLAAEARDIAKKARNILVAPQNGQEMVAEYVIHPPTRKFGDMEIVPKIRPLHAGSSPAFRKPVIDLSYPRQIAKYDKLGCKTLLSSVKHYVFGNSQERMTRAKCEAFFDDPTKFA